MPPHPDDSNQDKNPSKGGGEVDAGYRWGAGTLEHQRERVTRRCLQGGRYSKAYYLETPAMDSTTSQGCQ